MTGIVQRYNELIWELRLNRATSAQIGEQLPQGIEADFAAKLQRCWEAMTDDEQKCVDTTLIDVRNMLAQKNLNIIDENIPLGSMTLPRQIITR